MGEAKVRGGQPLERLAPRKPLVVGFRTRRATTVLFPRSKPAPLRGPWTLQAVISAN